MPTEDSSNPASQAYVDAPNAVPELRPSLIERLSARPGFLWAGLMTTAVVGFVLLTAGWFFRESFFLDDYVLCGRYKGVGDINRHYWNLTGPYRPMTYPVITIRTLTCDVFVIHKVFGLALHAAAGVLTFALIRKLGLGFLAAFTGAVVFIFNPLLFEAVGWAATVYGYPLAAVLVLLFILDVMAVPEPRWWRAAPWAVMAAMTNEAVLAVLLLVPLVALRGPFSTRLRGWFRLLWPTFAYLAVVTVTARFVGYVRTSAFGPEGVRNLFENFGWLQDGFLPMVPGGSQWRAFAAGNYGTSQILATALTVVVLVVVAIVAIRYDRDERRELGSFPLAVIAGTAAIGILGPVAPFLAVGAAFSTPRYLYLPQIGFALLAAVAVHLILQRAPALRWAALAVPLLWVLIVSDGLSREASSYEASYERDKAIATALANEMEVVGPSHVVLVNVPWSYAPSAPLVGHHIATAFVVPWAADSALFVLADHPHDAEISVDVGGNIICARDSLVEIGGQRLDAVGRTMIFDVDNLSRVGTLALPNGVDREVGSGGGTYGVLECPKT